MTEEEEITGIKPKVEKTFEYVDDDTGEVFNIPFSALDLSYEELPTYDSPLPVFENFEKDNRTWKEKLLMHGELDANGKPINIYFTDYGCVIS